MGGDERCKYKTLLFKALFGPYSPSFTHHRQYLRKESTLNFTSNKSLDTRTVCLEKEVEMLIVKIISIKREKMELRKDLDKEKIKFDAEMSDLIILENEVKSCNGGLEKRIDRMNELTFDKEKLERHISKLKCQLRALKEKIEESNKVLAANKRAFDAFNAKCAGLEKRGEVDGEELRHHKLYYENAIEENDTMHRSEYGIKALEEELVQAKSRLASRVEEIDQLQCEIQDIKIKNGRLNFEMESKISSIDSLEGLLRNSNSKMNKMNDDLLILKTLLKTADTKIESHEDEVAALRREFKERLQAVKEKYDHEIMYLKWQLEESYLSGETERMKLEDQLILQLKHNNEMNNEIAELRKRHDDKMFRFKVNDGSMDAGSSKDGISNMEASEIDINIDKPDQQGNEVSADKDENSNEHIVGFKTSFLLNCANRSLTTTSQSDSQLVVRINLGHSNSLPRLKSLTDDLTEVTPATEIVKQVIENDVALDAVNEVPLSVELAAATGDHDPLEVIEPLLPKTSHGSVSRAKLCSYGREVVESQADIRCVSEKVLTTVDDMPVVQPSMRSFESSSSHHLRKKSLARQKEELQAGPSSHCEVEQIVSHQHCPDEYVFVHSNAEQDI